MGRIEPIKNRAKLPDFSRRLYPRNTSKASKHGSHKLDIVECKWCRFRNRASVDECAFCGSDDFI